MNKCDDTSITLYFPTEILQNGRHQPGEEGVAVFGKWIGRLWMMGCFCEEKSTFSKFLSWSKRGKASTIDWYPQKLIDGWLENGRVAEIFILHNLCTICDSLCTAEEAMHGDTCTCLKIKDARMFCVQSVRGEKSLQQYLHTGTHTNQSTSQSDKSSGQNMKVI